MAILHNVNVIQSCISCKICKMLTYYLRKCIIENNYSIVKVFLASQ